MASLPKNVNSVIIYSHWCHVKTIRLWFRKTNEDISSLVVTDHTCTFALPHLPYLMSSIYACVFTVPFCPFWSFAFWYLHFQWMDRLKGFIKILQFTVCFRLTIVLWMCNNVRVSKLKSCIKYVEQMYIVHHNM